MGEHSKCIQSQQLTTYALTALLRPMTSCALQALTIQPQQVLAIKADLAISWSSYRYLEGISLAVKWDVNALIPR